MPNPAVTDTEASGQVLSSVPADSVYYAFAADWDGQIQDCSVTPCATYAYLQGTSMATPHVTGVAALADQQVRQPVARGAARQAESRGDAARLPARSLRSGAGRPVNCQGPAFYNNFYGAGKVDALAVVK